tara:strand:- start:149 stop:904 length:756 start_codon:yes stop_codon:yes gene_type:complete
MTNTRKPFFAGNWKMNGTKNSITELKKLKESEVVLGKDYDVIVCPPSTLLSDAKKAVENSKIVIGAQDCHFEKEGAFTGEISAEMLLDSGAEIVILGHSERRSYANESNETIRKKVDTAIMSGLKVILCIGETETERNQQLTQSVINKQILGCMPSNASYSNIVLAYEPVWAIGTGRTALPKEIEKIHFNIRKFLKEEFNEKLSQEIRIVYGGSVKPINAIEILELQNVDGALVGGASLKAEDFNDIIKSL